MPRGTRYSAEQIIGKLREAEVGLAQGKKSTEACEKVGVTDQTYYRWKKEYGGLRLDQAKLRNAVEHVRDSLGRDRATERRACRVLNQPRTTQLWVRHIPNDKPRLVRRMVQLASDYGRYGYRRVMALLRAEGWKVNHKRVERLWRREGLKVPRKQPKRRRLWLNDGSCVRLRSAHKDHVWSYDFVQDRTSDGRAFRLLTVIEEFSRECLTIDTARWLSSEDVLDD